MLALAALALLVAPGVRAQSATDRVDEIVDAAHVTVRQLLSNTSGLPGEEALAPDPYTLPDSAFAALVDRAIRADLAFEPGSEFRYTNTDYHALGHVVEAVTGPSYADALHDQVLGPLRMADTGLVRDDRVEPRLPAGYLVDSLSVRPMPPTRLAAFGAAGGLAGTADDPLRFGRALLADRLSLRALLDSTFASDPALGYVALSVWAYPPEVEGRTVGLVERQGWVGGYRALNLLGPDEDLVLIVMANTFAADSRQMTV